MARDPLIGQQLQEYRIEQQLGKGAFATVYRGKDIYLDIDVAIKVLNLASLSSRDEETYRQKFQQEARTIARLDHPRIIRVLRFGFTPPGLLGVQDQTPFLVMSYAPQGSLRDAYAQHTTLSHATIIKYTKQIADALQYAHDQKPSSLVHRDVKPDNIFLDASENVLVGDFGIAVIVSADTQSPRDRSGTYRYIAPEQTQGRPKPASDQYALAIMVYEWLSGDTPFKAEDLISLALAHLRESPPSLQNSISNREAIEQVLFKALAKKPDERYPRIMDFALALEQVLVQQPSLPFTSPILGPVIPATGSGPSDYKVPSTPAKPIDHTVSPRPMHKAASNTLPTGSKLLDYREHRAVVSTVACSPNGVYIASGDYNGSIYIWEKLTGNTITVYRKSEAPIKHILWATNEKLVFVCDHEVSLIDAASGRQERSFAAPVSINRVSLAANGSTLALAGKNSTIYIVDIYTNQVLLSLRHKAEVLGIAWNTIGTEFASASKDMTCRVYRKDQLLWEYSEYAGAGSSFPVPIAIGRGQWAITAVDWHPDGRTIAISTQSGMLRVLDSATGKPSAGYQAAVGVKSIAWHPHGKVLASLSQTVTLRGHNGEELLALPTSEAEAIAAFVWYPDGSALVTCSDTIVSVWK